jgi:gas vesicle protein
MKNSGSIFIGIIAAATAGVIIGMLIAPDKGENLRKNIKDSAGDWTKKLSDLMAEGKEEFKSLKSMFGESVNEFKNEAKNTKV